MTEVINKIDFWDAIVKTDNESISEGFLDFLYLHKDVFVVWYQMFPQLFFFNDKSTQRNYSGIFGSVFRGTK